MVTKLEYLFDDWQGDDLIKSFPCYLVSSELAIKLNQARLPGYRLKECSITTSETLIAFTQVASPQQADFKWLQITGEAGTDDIGLSAAHS